MHFRYCVIKVCVVDGEYMVERWMENGLCLDYNSTWPYYRDESGYLMRVSSIFGMTSADERGCYNANAFKLRFNLRHDSPEDRDQSLEWERLLIKVIW